LQNHENNFKICKVDLTSRIHLDPKVDND